MPLGALGTQWDRHREALQCSALDKSPDVDDSHAPVQAQAVYLWSVAKQTIDTDHRA